LQETLNFGTLNSTVTSSDFIVAIANIKLYQEVLFID